MSSSTHSTMHIQIQGHYLEENVTAQHRRTYQYHVHIEARANNKTSDYDRTLVIRDIPMVTPHTARNDTGPVATAPGQTATDAVRDDARQNNPAAGPENATHTETQTPRLIDDLAEYGPSSEPEPSSQAITSNNGLSELKQAAASRLHQYRAKLQQRVSTAVRAQKKHLGNAKQRLLHRYHALFRAAKQCLPRRSPPPEPGQRIRRGSRLGIALLALVLLLISFLLLFHRGSVPVQKLPPGLPATDPLPQTQQDKTIAIPLKQEQDALTDTFAALNKEDSYTLVQQQELIHIVIPGDTLWFIAKRYVHNPLRYPELARLSQIQNPDLIYPGDKIRIYVEK